MILSFIISGRSNDGDVVIVSDPAAFEIAVEIRGAVQTPGVYRLVAGCTTGRIAHRGRRRGGQCGCRTCTHNLARRLNDAEVVVIERISPATPVTAEPTQTVPQSINYRININTATNAELETLPGIGPVLAQRIIDDRVANGPNRDITDLARVQGISDTLIDEIRAQITVGP